MILSKSETLDRIAQIVTTGLSISYPFVLWTYGLSWQSILVLSLILTIMTGRALLALLQKKPLTFFQKNFLLFVGTLGIFLGIGYLINDQGLPYFYPVAASFSAGILFVKSLIYPPSLIEQFARLSEPQLDNRGVVYTRKVTILWTMYCFSNGFLSGGFSLWGTQDQWVLYNGVISYIIMGTLFMGEYGVRQWVRSRSRVR